MNQPDMSAQSTVYVAPDGRFASEGTMTVTEGAGMTMNISMSGDKTGAKMWMEAPGVGKFGSVLDFEAMKRIAPSQSADQLAQTRANMMQRFNFTCSAWTVDEARFAIPADVTFR